MEQSSYVKNSSKRVISSLLISIFCLTTIIPPDISAQSASILNLPVPGTMVTPSAGYTPVMVKGLTIHPDNPLQFDFIVDTGTDHVQGKNLEEESKRIIKYFLAALTTPEDEMWVNLSPYEQDRIIANGFGDTEMGRDLLAQDYILKQLMSSLMYPEDELGSEFWNRIYSQAAERFGTTDVPLNTFNKVWIVPEEASIYEQGASAFVIDSRLKVMLEEDYLAMQNRDSSGLDHKTQDMSHGEKEEVNKLSTQIIREILIPEIEKEVNEGKNFAKLRQIYQSMILAAWYKLNLKDSLLGKVYVDQNKTKGVDTIDKQVNQKIYQQYVDAFKKGVYDYIREEYDPVQQSTVPRRYFSGGVELFVMPQLHTIKTQPTALSKDMFMAVSQGLESIGPQELVRWEAAQYNLDSDLTLNLSTVRAKQTSELPWNPQGDAFMSQKSVLEESFSDVSLPSLNETVEMLPDEFLSVVDDAAKELIKEVLGYDGDVSLRALREYLMGARLEDAGTGQLIKRFKRNNGKLRMSQREVVAVFVLMDIFRHVRRGGDQSLLSEELPIFYRLLLGDVSYAQAINSMRNLRRGYEWVVFDRTTKEITVDELLGDVQFAFLRLALESGVYDSLIEFSRTPNQFGGYHRIFIQEGFFGSGMIDRAKKEFQKYFSENFHLRELDDIVLESLGDFLRGETYSLNVFNTFKHMHLASIENLEIEDAHINHGITLAVLRAMFQKEFHIGGYILGDVSGKKLQSGFPYHKRLKFPVMDLINMLMLYDKRVGTGDDFMTKDTLWDTGERQMFLQNIVQWIDNDVSSYAPAGDSSKSYQMSETREALLERITNHFNKNIPSMQKQSSKQSVSLIQINFDVDGTENGKEFFYFIPQFIFINGHWEGKIKVFYHKVGERRTLTNAKEDHIYKFEKNPFADNFMPVLQTNSFNGERFTILDDQEKGYISRGGFAKSRPVGGIDLNPALLNLRIKRDRKGAPLPMHQQNVDDLMSIRGFVPIIINITPINNVLFLLGFADRSLDDERSLSYYPAQEAFETKKRLPASLKEKVSYLN